MSLPVYRKIFPRKANERTLSCCHMDQLRDTLGAPRAQTCARVLRTLDP